MAESPIKPKTETDLPPAGAAPPMVDLVPSGSSRARRIGDVLAAATQRVRESSLPPEEPWETKEGVGFSITPAMRSDLVELYGDRPITQQIAMMFRELITVLDQL
jgi:hypothetical protein